MPKKAHFPGVNTVKDRQGNAVYYHRATKTRLPDDYGSPAFAAAWAAAEAAAHTIKPKGPDQDKYSYAGLVTGYQASGEWKDKAPRTKSDYQKVIDWMMEIGAHTRPAAALSQARAEKMIDLALKQRGWRFGCYVLQVNRLLYNWVLDRAARQKYWGDKNPWVNISQPKRPKGLKAVHRAWAADEFAAAITEANPGMARAFICGICGFDGATMYELQWDDYNEGRFSPERTKTAATGYSIVPAVLRPLMENDRPSSFIITNDRGERYKTLNAFQTNISKFLGRLARAEKVRPGLTLHGLRHTVGKIVADGGGGLIEIQAALQHKTARMALHYSREADKQRAALSTVQSLDSWFRLQNTITPVLQNTDGKNKKDSENNG